MLAASQNGEHALVTHKDRSKPQPNSKPTPPKQSRTPIPPIISHFVMNLPASAIEFLGSYRGVYAGHESLFGDGTGKRLPVVHVHCFSLKADDETPLNDICERITRELGFPMRPGDDIDVEGTVSVHNVRAVAPAKTMYCASFRLPREVAFAPRS